LLPRENSSGKRAPFSYLRGVRTAPAALLVARRRRSKLEGRAAKA